MKAKLKDKRLLLTAVFFCALAAMFLWPAEVKAETETVTAGDFIVTGGALGTDYSYDSTSGVLTVNSGANLTISNTDPETATDNKIVVAGDASITLSGVNISAPYYPPTSFKIEENASVNLTLSGANTLKSGNGAGLWVPVGAAVTIDGTAGTDSLTATGSNGGAGIGCGNYNSCGKITIIGGSINATGAVGIGGWGDDNGQDNGQTVEIKNGEIKANSIGNEYGSAAVTISGGTVNVEKNIKSGSDEMTISGGTVTTGENISGSGLVTISGGTVNTKKITANTLTVTDGNVTAHNGIDGGTLDVSGGTLTASGENEKAAINSNTVTISGGSVTANGGSYGAGIGGNNGQAGKNVTISGGMVVANGGSGNGVGGAGIGGGAGFGDAGSGGDGGTVTISGGTVVAKGGSYAAGIGGGRAGHGGVVVITGGSVKANNGGDASDIGGGQLSSSNGTLKDSSNNNVYLKSFTLQDSSGNSVNDAAIDDFTITYGIKDVRTDTEGKLYFYLPDSIMDNTPVTVTAGGTDYVGKVSGSATLKPFAGDIDLSQGGNLYIWNDGYMRGGSEDESKKKAYTGDYTLTGGTAESATRNTVIVKDGYTGGDPAEGGKTITLNGVNISASTSFMIEANASVNLKLSGGNTLKGEYGAGLRVPVGAAVTIDGTAGTDSLTATGINGAMGIGGGSYAPCGKIIITGGSINATGTVGIGGWGGDSSQTIEITGGEIKANSIGSGQGGSAAVTISGGTVVAGENISSSGLVTISGGTVNTKKSQPTRSL